MDFVVQHALDNVWAESVQDKDYYIRPARITPNGGSLKYAEVGITSIALPITDTTTRVFYHVYHIGQLPPDLLGINIVENSWTSIDKIADQLECYVNVFLDNGYVVPRSKCFFMRLWPSKNIIMAIQVDASQDYGKKIAYDSATGAAYQTPATLNVLDVNVRFYTNARIFATDERVKAKNPDNQMYFETATYDKNVYNAIAANSNITQGWYIAGNKIHNKMSVLGNYNNYVGKEISIYNDETIIGIEYFKLSDLATFTSEKNKNVKKYLINLETPVDGLVFHNDVEYYLGTYVSGWFTGLCIPTLRIDPITTVTNKSHAIRTDVLTDLITQNNWLSEAQSDLTLMVVIRQGGMLRGLIHQNTRIEELFKLPTDMVKGAMSGVNALLTEWQAATLENDKYASIVEASYKDVTKDMVIDAYGYNALTRYHHPNPLKVSDYTVDANNQSWYSVQLSNAATYKNTLLSNTDPIIEILEYGNDGKFIGRKRTAYQNAGLFISKQDSANPVAMIEHYVNTVEDNTLDLGEITTPTILDNDLELFGYAAYITTSGNGNTKPKWLDVTKISTYCYVDNYTRTDGSVVKRLVWNTATLLSANARGMVRINNRVCFKTFNVKDLIKPYRSFPVIIIPNNASGKVPVEPGFIEIWMEGYLLAEHIDYFVDWPSIYIGRRIKDVDTATISIRLSGLANPDTSKHELAREIGFVKKGILSVDNHYDIRNDRNIQINVGGNLKHRDDVSFDESRGTPLSKDGEPYQIRDYVTPIEYYTGRSTFIERAKSEDIDARVMAYLNQYVTTPPVDNNVITDTRWLIVSVFLDEIIGRMLAGLFDGLISTTWTLDQVDSWLADYKYLLAVDAAYFNGTNANFIRLIPHGRNSIVSLTERQFMLLNQIANKYLDGKVQINNFVVIKF